MAGLAGGFIKPGQARVGGLQQGGLFRRRGGLGGWGAGGQGQRQQDRADTACVVRHGPAVLLTMTSKMPVILSRSRRDRVEGRKLMQPTTHPYRSEERRVG